jgi:hypothetical protein
MLNRPATVYTGEKITASHLNDLVTYYNEIWTGGTYTFDNNHNTKNDNRRFGWGQTITTITPAVQAGKLIEANDINQAIVQVNAGQYHISDDPTRLLSKLAANHTDPISPVLYNSLVGKVETFETDKFKTEWSDLTLDVLETTNTTAWDQDLYCVHKFQFNDYNEARHFFNSGGELTLELSMQPGGTAGNDTWRQIFEQFDSIRIGAEGCRVVQDDADPKDILSTSTLAPKGFYNGITFDGSWNTILDAGVFRYTSGDYAYAYAYVYVAGEYNSRRIRIQLRGTEDAGKFNVFVKVILVEDDDDIFSITQPITLTSGHSNPALTPIPSDGNASFMTLGSLRQFLARTAPSVTQVEEWKSVDVTPGYQLPVPGGSTTYSLAKTASAVNEGDSFTISLVSNVATGTVLAYTITGVDTADISGASLTGNFVKDTTDSITFTVAADGLTEGIETFAIALDNGKASTSVTINDTSQSVVTPAYGLAVDNASVNEGGTFKITLTALNIPAGTVVPYTITGVTQADFTNTFAGSFTVGTVSGQEETFTVVNDVSIQEGDETFNLAITSSATTNINVLITDSSVKIYELQNVFADAYKNTSITNTQIQTRINAIEAIRQSAVAQSVSASNYNTMVTAFINDNSTLFATVFNSLTSAQKTAIVVGVMALVNNDFDHMNTNGNNTNYGATYPINYTADLTGFGNYLAFYINNQTAIDADILAFSNSLHDLSRANQTLLTKIDNRDTAIAPTTPVSSNDWYPI